MTTHHSIKIYPLTEYPSEAWKEISKTQETIKVNVEVLDESVQPTKVRFVCMSDTHSLEKNISFKIPSGDVYIHAGDFTNCGQREEVIKFNRWLGTLPFRHKVVVAGNHELTFDRKFSKKVLKKKGNQKDQMEDHLEIKSEDMKQYLTNCVYLQDSSINIYGIKLYGSPWQPESKGWAFNLLRGEKCLAVWNKIPEDTDILITHTPPLGYGDLVVSGVRVGCVELLNTVQQRVKPKYHVFGHVHESYGAFSDGKIIFINASTCDINNVPCNLPVVFDIPLPQGYIKEREGWKLCCIT